MPSCLGTLDMCLTGPGQTAAAYPESGVFEAPFVFRDNDHMQAVMNGEYGAAMWEDMAEEINARVLGTLYLGARYITTSDIEINSLADLSGVKLRVPDQPLSISLFETLGASPTPMSFSEVYLALQQGVVDGQENPLSQIMSANFYEVQNYVAVTGHTITSTIACINEDIYQSLPDDLKALLDEAVMKYCVEASDEIVEFEDTTLEQLTSEYDITVTYPDLDEFREAVNL